MHHDVPHTGAGQIQMRNACIGDSIRLNGNFMDMMKDNKQWIESGGGDALIDKVGVCVYICSMYIEVSFNAPSLTLIAQHDQYDIVRPVTAWEIVPR